MIYMVVIFLAMLAAIPVTMQFLMVSNQSTAMQAHQVTQAQNVARAGLTEAVSWFRRQTTQPVRSFSDPIKYPYPDAAFYPRVSTNAATSDTQDETIGLVKEFQLSEVNSLWARYEVKRQKTAGNPDPSAVHDVTAKRIETAQAGEGLAWYLESAGYVYQKKSGAAYNVLPNVVVGKARVATEIRRLALTLPINAAAIVNARNTVNVLANGKLIGGANIGLGYYTGSSGPTISGSGAQVTGTTAAKYDIDGSSAGTLSTITIFGVTQNELKLMADITVQNLSDLQSDYPSLAVVYINSDAIFNNSRELRGGGILFVNGNLTVGAGSNALFSGFIYVTGNATINGDCLISGGIAVQGNLTLQGSGGVAEVDFDDSILNSVRQQVAQYRENKAMYYVFSALK